MEDFKRLKDPIYGYINIPDKYITDIIDTAPFQRLRRIIQTSYAPLYSSAVHNRFVHSLGVYYLGNLASYYLGNEIKGKVFSDEDLSRIIEVYRLACLLHDVGHAPFSHTGEDFYLGEANDYRAIHDLLKELVNNPEFETDVPDERSEAAAPHEIMSAVIGLQEYTEFFINDEEKEFFARCITGYKYSVINDESSVKNCFIAMLNSTIIDVDKLDYLIRDAYVTGFDTVNIDYERLLGALTIIKNGQQYEIAYYKNAVSIIENVVYAHDAERKWIQSHPTVLYESYILKNIIFDICSEMEEGDKKLFSLDTLGWDGQKFNNGLSISLVSDDDIIFLMKNVYNSGLSQEYFERKRRRHPIWKSEAEYKTYILSIIGSGGVLETFEKAMEDTTKYLLQRSNAWAIDKEAIERLKKEIDELEKHDFDPTTKEVQEKDKKNILKIMECLWEYAQEKKVECDFVIVTASQFNSGFGKADFPEINIVFKNQSNEKIVKFGDIVSSFEAKERANSNFFYLFYKRSEAGGNCVDAEDMGRRLLGSFIQKS